MSTTEIAIRSVQHYMYCPHRWGLLEIDRAWAENFFVTKANLMHGRVHDPERSYISRGKRVFTSVPVYNDLEPYNLYGVVDCLELTEDNKGVSVCKSPEKYKICVVEYKPTKPKSVLFREDDLMQVFAQKICIDYVFGGDCESVIYYADVKKKVPLPLRENYSLYDEKLRKILNDMRRYMDKGKIPPIRKDQKCSGCSMKDLCMPSAKPVGDIRKEIRKIERIQE